MESSCQQAKRTKWALFEKEGENQRIERESIVERSKLGAKNGKLINKEWLPIESLAVISPYIFSRNVPSSRKTQRFKTFKEWIKSHFFVWKAKHCLKPMRAKQNQKTTQDWKVFQFSSIGFMTIWRLPDDCLMTTYMTTWPKHCPMLLS